MSRAQQTRSSGLVAVIGACGLACASAFAEPAATSTAGSPMLQGRVVRLADTTPGATSGLSTTSFVRVGNDVYFRSLTDGGSLWRSNGRPGGTIRLDTGVLLDPVPIGNSIVYLRGGTSAHGAAGLCMVVQGSNSPTLVAEGATQLPYMSARTSPGNCQVAGTRVFFTKAGGLASWDWLSGAQEQVTIPTGVGFVSVREVLAVGAKVFFLGQSSGTFGLWATDGTAAGTIRATTLASLPYATSTTSVMASDGARVYFTAQTTNGYKMWSSDGTVAGTVQVGTAPSLTASSVWTADGASGVYWAGTSSTSSTTGTQLWHFGTTAGAAEHLLSFVSGTTLLPLGSGNGASVFVDQQGYYSTGAKTLWITFGSQASTLVGPTGVVTSTTSAQVASTPTGSPLATTSGNEVYFARTTTATGTELWHVNVVTGAMAMVADLAPGATTTNPIQIVPRDGGNDAVLFTQSPQWRMWTIRADGSTLRYLTMPTYPYSNATPLSIGNRVFMSLASTGGIEPWVADLCPADYDNSGSVETADLFAYLNDWLAADRNADFDAPTTGATAPTMSDLVGYLNAWINGCP